MTRIKRRDVVTAKQLQVIHILRRGPMTGVEVARAMWPDSKGWRKQVKSEGFRSSFVRSNEAGMSRPAKAMLTRLMRLGLVKYEDKTRWGLTQNSRYELTCEGIVMAEK